MRRRLLAALRRLPLWVRSALVAMAVLLAVSAAAALSPQSAQQHRQSRAATPRQGTAAPAPVPPHPLPLARVELARARWAAMRFLASYLPFAYGQAPASAVDPVSPAVRGQLVRGGGSVTPAERRRHPHVMWLQVIAQSADLAHATALVEDGGVTSYAARVALRRERSGWVVTALGG